MVRLATREHARRAPSSIAVLTAALVAMGAVTRVAFLASPLGEIDSDEAVVGLMGRHASHGHFDAFFWGQHYGGAQEAVVVGLLRILKLPIFLAVKLVPILFFALASVLVWRIARRVVSEPLARLAGALSWAYPAAVVWMSVKERGFYGAALALALAAVLFALRLDETWSRGDAVMLGLCAGSAWYATPQALYLLAPTAVWLIARAVLARDWARVGSILPFVLVGLVVGAAPWLAANMSRGWASLQAQPQPPSTYGHRLELFVNRGVPVSTGFMHPFLPSWFGGAWGRASLVGVLALAFGGVAWRLRGGDRPAAIAPLLLIVVAYPFVFAWFPTSWFVDDPRYFTFLPAVGIVVGVWLLSRLPGRAQAAVVVLVALLGLRGTVATIDYGDTVGRWDVAAQDLEPLLAALDTTGVDRVFADYWIAHRLALETDEAVIAAALQDIRRLDDERAVRAEPLPAYATFAGSPYEVAILEHLESRSVVFERERLGVYSLIRPGVRVLPEEISPEWLGIRRYEAADVLEPSLR